MKTWAVINNNAVTNVMVCESKELAEQISGFPCVEYTNENPAAIGWAYDGKTFTAPDIQALSEVTTEPVK
jgi:hypothetical protein